MAHLCRWRLRQGTGPAGTIRRSVVNSIRGFYDIVDTVLLMVLKTVGRTCTPIINISGYAQQVGPLRPVVAYCATVCTFTTRSFKQ